MKLRNLLLVLAAAAILAGQTVDMGVTLERAVRKENVEGDLSGAIELYKKVVAASANRADIAKALLGLGECYEKQGSAEAQKAYERLVKEFGDQAEAARQAQARLAAMGKTRGGEGVVAQLIARDAYVDQRGTGLTGRVTPDGKLYVFVDPVSGNLATRDLESGAVKRLTNDATGGKAHDAHAANPIPSRDGRQVAFAWGSAGSLYAADHPVALRVINIDGSGMRTTPAQLGRSLPTPLVLDWTPDGKSILIAGPVPESAPVFDLGTAQRPPAYGYATVDLKTGEVHAIARSRVFSDAGLSPDGRWLVYSRGIRDTSSFGIFALDIHSLRETAIVDGPGRNRDAMWVPGADRPVFRSDRKGNNGIWMVRFKDGAAAGDPILIKQDAGDYTPLGVSRDGSLFYGLSHESSDIYSVAVDPVTLRAQGTPVVAVTSYPGRNMWPSWSPSGDAFAYYSDREAGVGHRLVIRHTDGKETVASAAFPAFAFPPNWCGGDQLFDFTTGEVRRMLRNTTPLPSQLGISPACGSAYISAQTDNLGRRIYRYEIATDKETDLLLDRGELATMPLVPPDGKWLALWGRLEGSTKTTVMLLPAQGGSLRALDVDGLNDYGYSWTPDSKRLLVSRRVESAGGKGPEDELFWVSVEGGAPQPIGIRMPGGFSTLSASRVGLSPPSLNPDGKRLLYSATETSNELWVLRNLALK